MALTVVIGRFFFFFFFFFFFSQQDLLCLQSHAPQFALKLEPSKLGFFILPSWKCHSQDIAGRAPRRWQLPTSPVALVSRSQLKGHPGLPLANSWLYPDLWACATRFSVVLPERPCLLLQHAAAPRSCHLRFVHVWQIAGIAHSWGLSAQTHSRQVIRSMVCQGLQAAVMHFLDQQVFRQPLRSLPQLHSG